MKDNNGLDDMFVERLVLLSGANFYQMHLPVVGFVILDKNEVKTDNFYNINVKRRNYGTFVSIKINTYKGIAILDRFMRVER